MFYIIISFLFQFFYYKNCKILSLIYNILRLALTLHCKSSILCTSGNSDNFCVIISLFNIAFRGIALEIKSSLITKDTVYNSLQLIAIEVCK